MLHFLQVHQTEDSTVVTGKEKGEQLFIFFNTCVYFYCSLCLCSETLLI